LSNAITIITLTLFLCYGHVFGGCNSYYCDGQSPGLAPFCCDNGYCCDMNSFNPGDIGTCWECQAGSYDGRQGGGYCNYYCNSANDCTSNGYDSFVHGGNGLCTPCELNKWSLYGSQACNDCPSGLVSFPPRTSCVADDYINELVSIESFSFQNNWLRMDASNPACAVNSPNACGIVNFQYYGAGQTTSSWETFLLHKNPNGNYCLMWAADPHFYLRMDATCCGYTGNFGCPVTLTSQYYQYPYTDCGGTEEFALVLDPASHIDNIIYSIRSVYYGNVYLRSNSYCPTSSQGAGCGSLNGQHEQNPTDAEKFYFRYINQMKK